MRSPTGSPKPEGRQKDTPPDEETDAYEAPFEVDENDLDESDLQDLDDDRWDVFVLDDDSDLLPDYGDFWFPD